LSKGGKLVKVGSGRELGSGGSWKECYFEICTNLEFWLYY